MRMREIEGVGWNIYNVEAEIAADNACIANKKKPKWICSVCLCVPFREDKNKPKIGR